MFSKIYTRTQTCTLQSKKTVYLLYTCAGILTYVCSRVYVRSMYGEASKLPRKASSRKGGRVVVKVSTVCKEVRGTPLFLCFFFGYG